jgi:NADH:ubiquinone oxidoreductase subunit 6 (subunit J)
VAHEDVVAEEEAAADGGSGTARWFGAVLAAAMALELVWALNRSRDIAAARPGGERETAWSGAEIGKILFTNYAFAFEATSVLILIAMVGSMTLAGRHLTGKKPWRG